MIPIKRNELIGTNPVFLLEITWGGQVYRFSTYPIDLIADDGQSIHFTGGLEDPDLEESLEDLSKNPEKNTLPIEVVFPIDLIKQFMQYGRTLDNANGELSLVTERATTILQTYEKRIRLFSGDIIQPIIGDPSQPPGYCNFTIERNPNNQASPIIGADGIFQGVDSIVTSKSLDDYSNGDAYPLVFGNPHEFLMTGQLGNANLAQSYPTPGFIIYREQTSVHGSEFDKFWVCIADRQVQAATVTVRDYKGNKKTAVPVKKTITLQGREISYVLLQYATYSGGATVIVDGIVNPWMLEALNSPDGQTSEPKYYISWDDGGGIFNPYGDGFLEGGGDVALFFLELSGVDIDRNAWRNVAAFLNKWRFAGFINDPQIEPYKFLQDNIFPFLPVYCVNGPDGLRPVIPLLYESQIPRTVLDVEIGRGFYFISAIDWSSEPDDIINRLLFRYGFCLFRDKNPGTIIIDGNLETSQHSEIKTSNEISLLSYTQYGDRYEEMDGDFVYDWRTATKTVQYIVRKNALPKMQMEIQADTQDGWLQLGDILSLNSSGYFMQNFKVQIIEKAWKNGSWVFMVELENNITINTREI